MCSSIFSATSLIRVACSDVGYQEAVGGSKLVWGEQRAGGGGRGGGGMDWATEREGEGE